MKLAVRLLMLAGLMALAYWGWRAVFLDPRKVVRQRLEKLAQSKLEILDHEKPWFVSVEMLVGSVLDSTS